jgi:trehalose-phosphatase
MTGGGRHLPNDFCRRLRNGGGALLLDYDGTLAPFRIERQDAFPYPGVREALKSLLEAGRTRLVIVSGRTTGEVRALLGITPSPEIWGCHGWERRFPDGRLWRGELPPAGAEALTKAAVWARQHVPADRCEEKPFSIALHWRGLVSEEAVQLQRHAETAWTPLARSGGLELHPFDGGLELRCPGHDKGTAVRDILAEVPPEMAIAYLGDDLTDEDAFRALHGRGLGVLVRTEPRPTAASQHLVPPRELLEFLYQWHQIVKGE